MYLSIQDVSECNAQILDLYQNDVQRRRVTWVFKNFKTNLYVVHKTVDKLSKKFILELYLQKMQK